MQKYIKARFEQPVLFPEKNIISIALRFAPFHY